MYSKNRFMSCGKSRTGYGADIDYIIAAWTARRDSIWNGSGGEGKVIYAHSVQYWEHGTIYIDSRTTPPPFPAHNLSSVSTFLQHLNRFEMVAKEAVRSFLLLRSFINTNTEWNFTSIPIHVSKIAMETEFWQKYPQRCGTCAPISTWFRSISIHLFNLIPNRYGLHFSDTKTTIICHLLKHRYGFLLAIYSP